MITGKSRSRDGGPRKEPTPLSPFPHREGGKRGIGYTSFIKIGAVLLLAGLLIFQPGRVTPTAARAADAPQAKFKVMPLGDSITSGSDTLASYRCELLKKLDLSYYDFVGSVTGQMGNGEYVAPPSYCTMLDPNEEGHSGWRVDNILEGDPNRPELGNIHDWAFTYRPDLVLIHLGTVDLIKGESVDSTVEEIGEVIDVLRAANPRVKIILAQIIPSRYSSYTLSAIPQFNNQLPGLVASKAQSSSPILLVNMYTNFDPALYTVDGIHPNPSGEAKMAGRWKTAIDQIMVLGLDNHTFVPLVNR